MKPLETLIKTLNDEQVKDFTRSISEFGRNNRGIDYDVFMDIRNHLDIERENKNAYHSSRKRILKKLINYIHLEEIRNSNSEKHELNSHLSIAKYLYNQGDVKSAWIFLNKAEKIALNERSYESLNSIYLAQIQYFDSEFSKSINLLIDKYQQNKKYLDLEEKLKIGNNLIKNEVNQIKIYGKEVDLDNLVNNIDSQLEIDSEKILNPKFAYHYLVLHRNVSKARKNYHDFAPLAIKTYNRLIENNMFLKTELYYELSIIYMICHTLLRTRKFDELDSHLNTFDQKLNSCKTSIKHFFESKYILIKASYFALTNQLDKAIELAEIDYPQFEWSERLNLLLNLGLYHFMKGNFSEVLMTNHKIGHSEKWLEKKMGREWVMKKSLMEIIAHYDLQNFDLCENLVRSIQIRFKDLLNTEKYSRAKIFIKIINQKLYGKDLKKLLTKNNLITVSKNEEDLQAMMFYCWLKSKQNGQSFYETILSTVNS